MGSLLAASLSGSLEEMLVGKGQCASQASWGHLGHRVGRSDVTQESVRKKMDRESLEMPEKNVLLLQTMSSVPTIFMAAHGRPSVLFWPMQAPAYMWCLYIH